MKLHELKSIIDGLVEVHGGDMDARFRYKFASGRLGSGPVTSYAIHPPKPPLRGSVHFTIDYARGEEK